jgi:hypothetical protein
VADLPAPRVAVWVAVRRRPGQFVGIRVYSLTCDLNCYEPSGTSSAQAFNPLVQGSTPAPHPDVRTAPLVAGPQQSPNALGGFAGERVNSAGIAPISYFVFGRALAALI